MDSSYTVSSVLCASIYPLAASSKPSAFTFSQLSPFPLISTSLSSFCKELTVSPSAKRHCTQVVLKAMMNPLRLHNLFMDFHIRDFERKD